MVVFLNLLSFRVELFFSRMVFYKSSRQAQIGKECKRKACERYLMTIHQVTRACWRRQPYQLYITEDCKIWQFWCLKLKTECLQIIFLSCFKDRTLRNSNFMIPRFNTITFGKYSIKYLGPYLWRKLPIALKTLTETDKCKRKIRESDLAGHLMEDKCRSECCRNAPYAASYPGQFALSELPKESWKRLR